MNWVSLVVLDLDKDSVWVRASFKILCFRQRYCSLDQIGMGVWVGVGLVLGLDRVGVRVGVVIHFESG